MDTVYQGIFIHMVYQSDKVICAYQVNCESGGTDRVDLVHDKAGYMYWWPLQ